MSVTSDEAARTRSLLRQKESAMAQQMDRYYRAKIADVLREEKARAGEAHQQLAAQRDEALRVAEEAYKQGRAQAAQFAAEKARWGAEKASRHDQAEKGFKDLYTSLHSQNKGALSQLSDELGAAKGWSEELAQENQGLKNELAMLREQ